MAVRRFFFLEKRPVYQVFKSFCRAYTRINTLWTERCYERDLQAFQRTALNFRSPDRGFVLYCFADQNYGEMAFRASADTAPQVALTFDDGPDPVWTPQLLDGLKERGVHATFFLIGKKVEGQEKLVERIYREGHLIGNHTYNHVDLSKLAKRDAKEEIEKTSNEIYKITGEYPCYLRPPFGRWREELEFQVEMLPVIKLISCFLVHACFLIIMAENGCGWNCPGCGEQGVRWFDYFTP